MSSCLLKPGATQLPYMSNVSAFFNEFLGTLILMMAVLAINDRKNTPPPAGLAPLALFLVILGIGASLGLQTGASSFHSTLFLSMT